LSLAAIVSDAIRVLARSDDCGLPGVARARPAVASAHHSITDARRIPMRRLTIIGVLAGLVALAAMSAAPAGAHVSGPNGRIAFARFEPALGTTFTYTVDPDGGDLRRLFARPSEFPHWSPDGGQVAMFCCDDGMAAHIVNPDTGGFRELANPDPNLEIHCGGSWSPDGQRLTCETFGLTDPSRNGVYTIRSSGGGGLTRVTSNPGGDDIPGDYAPNGKRLVFGRVDHPTDPAALGVYVVKVGGNRLRQIAPAGLLSSFGDWSPQGNDIVFSQHVTPDARSSLWVVHADGTALHEIPVQAQPACGGAYSDPSSQGCFGPRWSPDGKQLVFARGTSEKDSNIYTVNADGTDLTQITHGDADSSPDWGTHPLIG
jgi:Tol biopolymer transport system component